MKTCSNIGVDRNEMTKDKKVITVFAVKYIHIRLPDGGDLYFTEYGVPWIDNLMPDKFWADKEWFKEHSSKLFGHDHRSGGSGTIYHVRTKPVNSRSKDIVMKWNRMAQDVPGHRDHDELLTPSPHGSGTASSLPSACRACHSVVTPRGRYHRGGSAIEAIGSVLFLLFLG
jgi:hypothetical protein